MASTTAEEEPVASKYTSQQIEQIWADYMIEGARYGDMEDVDDALARRTDANATDTSGRTALHMAAANGHTDVMRRLLAAGANTEQRNDSGNTALHWACMGGHVEAVQLLLKRGADPAALNRLDRTPLDGALDNEKILRVFQQHRIGSEAPADGAAVGKENSNTCAAEPGSPDAASADGACEVSEKLRKSEL